MFCSLMLPFHISLMYLLYSIQIYSTMCMIDYHTCTAYICMLLVVCQKCFHNVYLSTWNPCCGGIELNTICNFNVTVDAETDVNGRCVVRRQSITVLSELKRHYWRGFIFAGNEISDTEVQLFLMCHFLFINVDGWYQEDN
eukprot:485189_1